MSTLAARQRIQLYMGNRYVWSTRFLESCFPGPKMIFPQIDSTMSLKLHIFMQVCQTCVFLKTWAPHQTAPQTQQVFGPHRVPVCVFPVCFVACFFVFVPSVRLCFSSLILSSCDHRPQNDNIKLEKLSFQWLSRTLVLYVHCNFVTLNLRCRMLDVLS